MPWRRQIDHKILHFVFLDDSNIILNELKSLHCLNEMLLVKILLVALTVLLLIHASSLWYLGHELIQSITRVLLLHILLVRLLLLLLRIIIDLV